MGVRGSHGSEDVAEEQGFAARLPEWAREREDGRWYGPRPAAQSSQQAKPRAPTNSVVVVVRDEGENDWAKARVFDNPGEAAAVVETLVEGGLARGRVTVFSGAQMVVDVAYQAVVELKESRKQAKSAG